MIWNGLELPDKGVYFRDEDSLIYCADCRGILPLIPDKSIDMVLTSPPYDNLREYGGHEWNFQETANGLKACLSDGCVIVWVVGDATLDGSETGSSFKQALYFKEIGLNLYDTMIYHRNSPPLNHRRYEQNFEYMFILSNGIPKSFNPIMRPKLWEDHRKVKNFHRHYATGDFKVGKPSQLEVVMIGNVWQYEVGGGHSTDFKLAFEHPAIFPEALANDHIISWSNLGDIILDPFLGSGTTTYCAKKLGRKCIGIEIEEKYCAIAVKRLSQSVMRMDV